MTIHDKLKCPRCRRIPRHISLVQHLNTGVDITSTHCLHCGRSYRWRVVPDDSARVLLCDDRAINPVRLKYLRRKEGVQDAHDAY